MAKAKRSGNEPAKVRGGVENKQELEILEERKCPVDGCNSEGHLEERDLSFQQFDYCKAECFGATHVSCQDESSPKPCKIKCSHKHNGYEYPTDEQRETILDKHNTIRNKIAGELEKSGGLLGRKLTDVMILSWNYESEFIASCKVKECNIKHDKCRSIENGTYCGQNGGWRTGVTPSALSKPDAFNLTMNNWYKEIKKCDDCRYDTYPPLEKDHLKVAHFTQVIWGKTTHIGCSYFYYEDKKPQAVLFCNYCPAGNYKDQPIIKEADPGPDCGKDRRYPFLCGVQVPLKATRHFFHTQKSFLLIVCTFLIYTVSF